VVNKKLPNAVAVEQVPESSKAVANPVNAAKPAVAKVTKPKVSKPKAKKESVTAPASTTASSVFSKPLAALAQNGQTAAASPSAKVPAAAETEKPKKKKSEPATPEMTPTPAFQA
jgi:hypothetical protein